MSMDYKIVWLKDAPDIGCNKFSALVKAEMNDGWMPIGGVCSVFTNEKTYRYSSNSVDLISFYQAMIKD
jgi:hypothetical protein